MYQTAQQMRRRDPRQREESNKQEAESWAQNQALVDNEDRNTVLTGTPRWRSAGCRTENQIVDAVERTHRTVQAAVRALRLDRRILVRRSSLGCCVIRLGRTIVSRRAARRLRRPLKSGVAQLTSLSRARNQARRAARSASRGSPERDDEKKSGILKKSRKREKRAAEERSGETTATGEGAAKRCRRWLRAAC